MKKEIEQYYDRNKLYAEIWELTMVEICKQYGVTHSALVEVCKVLNIPRPHVGYWTQKELGKASPPTLLPPFDNPPRLLIHPPEMKKEIKPIPPKKADNMKPEPKRKPLEEKIEVKKVIIPPKQESESKFAQAPLENTAKITTKWQERIPKEGLLVPQAFKDAIMLIEKEALPEMAITISKRIKNEHPYLKNTRIRLEEGLKTFKNYPSALSFGRIQCNQKDMFDVNIGPDSIPRVLNILQALCNVFEKRGFDLVYESDEYKRFDHIYVIIMDEKITFSIKEGYKRVKLEKNEKDPYQKYKYIPTGILTLQDSYQWSDTKEQLLEEKLDDIIASFIFAAAWKKEEAARKKKAEEEAAVRRKKEEEEQRWRDEIRRKEERLARIEKQRIVNFRKGTEHWIEYQNMAAFLTMVKRAYKKSREKNNDTEKWICWAGDYLAKFRAAVEDRVRYDVGEYDEYKEKKEKVRPIYNQPKEPYNYWERPWYMRKKGE